MKLTVDIKQAKMVVGGELHADAEQLLLEHSSNVLNLRPRLDNNSIEILHPKRRELFLGVVKKTLG